MIVADKLKMEKMMSAEEIKRVSMETIAGKALIKNLVKGHFSGGDDDDLRSRRWYWIQISTNNTQLLQSTSKFYRLSKVLLVKCACKGKDKGPELFHA